jgi:hypothetical protein
VQNVHARVTARHESAAFASARGLPIFLDQLSDALRRVSSSEKLDHATLAGSASALRDDRFHEAVTVSQVVDGYGDLFKSSRG